MKTKPTNDFLTELSKEEYATIYGGEPESAWYWIAYGAGVAVREAKDAVIGVYVFVQSNRSVFSSI